LAGGAFGVDYLASHTSETIAASKTYSQIRLSKSDGDYNLFEVGSASVVSGFASFLKSASGSHSSSNLYAGILQGSNAGPGTVKALHVLAAGVTGSTGVLAGASFDVAPVSGQGETFAIQVATSGLTNFSTGILFSTNNSSNFAYGIDLYGSNTHPGYNTAAIRLPYSTWISSRNSGGTGDSNLIRLATVDSVAGTVEMGAPLNITGANAYFKLDVGGTAWTFQEIDADGRFRILRAGIGDAFTITAAGITGLWKGGNVASAAAITPTGNVFHVTGTTSITSITSTGIINLHGRLEPEVGGRLSDERGRHDHVGLRRLELVRGCEESELTRKPLKDGEENFTDATYKDTRRVFAGPPPLLPGRTGYHVRGERALCAAVDPDINQSLIIFRDSETRPENTGGARHSCGGLQ
jgi:hypothetical protein